MKQWFTNLSTREKTLVSVGGVIAILLIAYLILVEPINHSINNLSKQVQYNHTLLSWMEQANQEIQALPKTNAAQQQASLAGIAAALTQQDLSKRVMTLTQQNSQTYQIQLKQASFDKFMSAVIAVHQQFGLQISKLKFKQAGPGLVSGTATLTAGQS